LTRIACLTCGQDIPEASAIEGASSPSKGDVSVCLYCGAVAMFTGKGNEVRYPHPTELAEVLSDPTVQKVRRARHALRRLSGDRAPSGQHIL
jgi:DNA-directed RNA polymerase subunit RPC12/RpoP